MYNERFIKLSNDIVSFHNDNKNGINYGCSLPNRKNIVKITTNLLELVFPGFFTDCQNNCIDGHSECVLKTTFELMKEQIKRALKNEVSDDKLEETAMEISFSFFEKITKVTELAHTDVLEAFDGDPAATDTNIIISCYPGIFATTIQRLAHELYLLKVPYIPRIMTEYAHGKTGIDIHPGATIGKYFFIDHGTGVVIGETTVIGEHVKIYQGVTLGAISTKDGQNLKGVKRHPTIKDYVTIYSDASVLGGDTIIYDGVTIAGNAFVTKSVERKQKGYNKDYSDYII